jgi:hypothetical protein
MEVPTTRAEFEIRLNLVREQLLSGKLHPGPAIDDLAKVRFLPNGRIDMLSINESARLHANMTYNFSTMDLGRFTGPVDAGQ